MEELIKLVQEWANNKGLNKPEQAYNQCCKVVSEYGETCDAIAKRAKNGDADIIDGFGDITVTLIVLCNMLSIEYPNLLFTDKKLTNNGNILSIYSAFDLYPTIEKGDSDYTRWVIKNAISRLYQTINAYNFTVEQCLTKAYNEIKDRKGVTVNGTFIKDEVKETPQVVDLSEVELGDSVEFRDGEIEQVLTIKFNEQSPEPYKLSGEHFSASFMRNGNWSWNGGETENDIIRVIKA